MMVASVSRLNGNVSADAGIFPLSISGRGFVTASSAAFPIWADTPWSALSQLTTNQMDTYLNTRQSQGFNAVLFNAPDENFSTQTPTYQNINGDNPFGTMSPLDLTDPVEAYWLHVDYWYDGCIARGILPMLCPLYFGFEGTGEGWYPYLSGLADADFQDYGAFLATRYPYCLWVLGGDNERDGTARAQQWNIVTGIRSVNASAIVTAHGSRGNIPYDYWGAGGDNLTGFNVSNIYTRYSDNNEYDKAASAYADGLPFFNIENQYDEDASPAWQRVWMFRQVYASILSGACGYVYGNSLLWGFGYPDHTAAEDLADHLSTQGVTDLMRAKTFFASYPVNKLVPKTDTSLVTTSLGTGDSRVCPALSSDSDFALVWKKNSSSIAVDMSNFVQSSVRVRWFDPTDGSYTAVDTFSNSGTQEIAHPGNNANGSLEWVLVCD